MTKKKVSRHAHCPTSPSSSRLDGSGCAKEQAMLTLSKKPSMLTRAFCTVQRFQAAKTSALALTVALAAIFFQSAHAQNLALGKTCTAISF